VTLRFGASILILAPHPDDEVVGCAAAIGRARAAGATVSVIFLTHGCVDRESMWPWARGRYGEAVARRQAEAERVCAELGVAVAGWSERPARHLWRELDAGEAEVRRAIAATGADQLWAPAYEGGNPDHDGANAIASRLAAEGTDVLEFAEYNFLGGRPRLHCFPHPTGAEQVLELTGPEQTMKRRCLSLYASERGNLGYVAIRREVFRPLAPYDYGQPPHAGRLWYARFQWVPFRHPQVDFTRADNVCAAIAAYLAGPGALAAPKPPHALTRD
jgi:LmbE family N-acetylglucosaminyl deacetylase